MKIIALVVIATVVSGAHGDLVRKEAASLSLDHESRLLGKKSKKKVSKKKLKEAEKAWRESSTETISVGNKRPYGITTAGDGTNMFVSEAFFGGIKKVNVRDGRMEQLVPSYPHLERGAYGIARHMDALFVAGGGIPDGSPVMMYVYNAETGEEIAACMPESDAFFLKDVAIAGDSAYATDSKYNRLMKVDVAAAMDGVCVVDSIETPAEYFLGTNDDTKQSGIIAYGDGLILARASPGGLYYFDLETKTTIELSPPDESPSSDGLTLVDDVLYATASTLNFISAWRLKWRDDEPLRLQYLGRRDFFGAWWLEQNRDSPLSIEYLGRLDVSGRVEFDFPCSIETIDMEICAANFGALAVAPEEAMPDFNVTFYINCVDRSDVEI